MAKRDGASQLQTYNEMRKARTVACVAAAIKHLKQEQRGVSLAAIRETVMSTANGRRLSENTITRNKDAYALYHAAAGQRRTAHRVASSKWLLKDVADKDLKTAKSVIGALRRKSKSELVLLGWENAKQIKALEEELKLVRAKKLDAIVPYSVKVLRPLSRR